MKHATMVKAKVPANRKNKSSGSGGMDIGKAPDYLAIKPRKDLKYKRNYSFGEHYDKAFEKTFGKMKPAKTVGDKIAKGIGMALSPTIAMEAAYNKFKNKQYKAMGGKISKYYKDGGIVITGRD
tara:strand:+ start:131 stop:502 length:372 start_codon:yes stop_codon:yes gene_type:complete